MEYTKVKLEKMLIAGKQISTTFANDKCFEEVPALWNNFFQEGIFQSIQKKTDFKPLGVYFNVGLNGEQAFDFVTGCKVSENANPELDAIEIPASNYAKFSFGAPTPENINKAWETIAGLDLDKNTGFDFEEYNMNAEDETKSTFDCYVSVK
ncbi:GyrI-like domain-containing protein [Saccharicrinis aurantiacus]|uniref:GyrI-like domain-containing protein n=1 Tax=Saccharicrinis aurantiacus TaxID=1849719 RepID=UPI00249313DD|nr:effector binding domain-containing protein [Saccharicrinis aurantiacus]